MKKQAEQRLKQKFHKETPKCCRYCANLAKVRGHDGHYICEVGQFIVRLSSWCEKYFILSTDIKGRSNANAA